MPICSLLWTCDLFPGSGLGRDVLETLSGSVAACMKMCQQAQREGIAPVDIITSDQSALSTFSRPGLPERWQQVMQACSSTQSTPDASTIQQRQDFVPEQISRAEFGLSNKGAPAEGPDSALASKEVLKTWECDAQALRLGEAQSTQLVKWHEGHLKQLQAQAEAQRPLIQEVSMLA